VSGGAIGRLVPLAGRAGVPATAEAGFKAGQLSRAARAGLPVLPGWVVPVAEGKRAMRAGAHAVRDAGLGAGRAAALEVALDPALSAELQVAVGALGGQVIVRSSSPLEGDPLWAGAFSSVTGVRRDDVARAVRSCWGSAFAVDPVRRLEACGLPLDALELGVLLQPEIVPEAGGVARVTPGMRVTVEGVAGHPGPLLSGWAEARPLAAETVADVTRLAARVYGELGDDVIEWAAWEGKVWLLQSLRGAPPASRAEPALRAPAALPSPDGIAALATAPRDRMPELAAAVQAHGTHAAGRPAAPGTAAGVLLACRPHEPVARDTILLADRPLAALAPLLFGARGVICRTGAAGSHLAEIARSLGVPMVIGCGLEALTGPGPGAGGWAAAIDGTTGDVAVAELELPHRGSVTTA
jgi:pyruvate, water dikinase